MKRTPKLGALAVARELLQWATVALCLWAGLYHTPLGALGRAVAAWAFGQESSRRPLLSYYSGGAVAAAAGSTAVAQQVGRFTAHTDASAAALGAWSAYRAASPSVRAAVLALTAQPASVLEQERAGPQAIAKALRSLKAGGASEAGAALALFAGAEPAQFAEERAKAERRGLALDDLARQLPPGYEAALGSAALALTLSVAYSLDWPAGEAARVTSPFGWRVHPVSGVKKFHKGVDFGIATGTAVRAAADGVVTRSSYDQYNGNIVVVSHGHGVRTLYLHNTERLVALGDRVKAGELLARSGATGVATGPHLHYQLELGAEPADPIPFTTVR